MPLRKSHLYSSLWQSCDQLRGGMDASQYKDYVLTLLFMKYVSDKYAGSDDSWTPRCRRAGGRDDSAAHGTADQGTLEHDPTGFVRRRRINSRFGALANRTHGSAQRRTLPRPG